MSRHYITGKESVPGGPESGTGEEDVQILENVDLRFGDNEQLKFGDGADVTIEWDGTNFEILPAADDTGSFNIGNGTLDIDFKVFLGSTADFVLLDVGNSRLESQSIDVLLNMTDTSSYVLVDESEKTFKVVCAGITGSSEHDGVVLDVTSANTFLTGTNLTYSGARGSAILKLVGTASMASGGFEGIDIKIATSGAFSGDGNGVMGLKCVVTNTAALADGEIYGGQFIAKHNHATNVMVASASLVGLEAWAYISAAGVARTCIGGNFGWHNEATGGTYGAGSVIRGVQIFCDNNAGGNDPVESTGLCVWNQAGAIINVLKIVNSGSGFTYFADFTDDGAPAQSTSSSVTNVGTKGWIKVKVGTATRYIALGDDVT